MNLRQRGYSTYKKGCYSRIMMAKLDRCRSTVAAMQYALLLTVPFPFLLKVDVAG